jgi:formate dehydrogenase assembly factor FdhD
VHVAGRLLAGDAGNGGGDMNDYDECLCGHFFHKHSQKGKCSVCACDDYDAKGKPDADALAQQLTAANATIAALRSELEQANRIIKEQEAGT